MEPESKPLVYIPPNAEINIEKVPLPPPKVRYENRKAIISRDELKDKVTKKDTP
jgi:hypothetical protein